MLPRADRAGSRRARSSSRRRSCTSPSSAGVTVGRVELGDDAPAQHHEQPVGQADQLLEVGRDRAATARPAARASRRMSQMTAWAPTSTPRVGCAAMQHLGVARHLAADDQLLLVAAGQRERRHVDARRAHVELVDDLARSRSRDRAAVDRQPPLTNGAPLWWPSSTFSHSGSGSTRPSLVAVLRDVADAGHRAGRSVASVAEVAALEQRPVPLAVAQAHDRLDSSVWPLPSTPAMPTISPPWTSNDTSVERRRACAGRRP